ncbi:MAG: AraC family transcriptional regulator ligand-binding domain-containing protein [Rhodospirillales bacterium]
MTAAAIPLARTAALAPFIRFLDGIGTPTERLLERSGLSPQLLFREDTLFALRQGLTFIDRSARVEKLPHMGLIVGQQTRIAQLGELGQLLSPSMTLFTAILTLAQVIRLFSSAERLSIHYQGEKVFFCHALSLGNCAGRRHGDLFTLMLMIDLIRCAAGRQWHPCAVWLPLSEAAHRASYEELLQTVVRFHGEFWAIALDRSLLADQLRYVDNRADRNGDALQSLQALAPASDFVGSLRQVIASCLGHGNAHIGLVADAAGLSVRTLQRRLAEQRRSYSHLVEEARLQAAHRLLQDGDVKLVDVALELGYSDAANFTRAFRRWTGLSPREARRRTASS